MPNRGSMSNTKEPTRDIFAEARHSFEKINSNVEKVIPQYLQSFTNLQQEYLAAWTNFVSTAISSQQEFVHKIGIDTRAPEATIKVIQDTTDEVVKAIDVQNKVITTSLDATRQNVKAANATFSSLAELNHNIVNSWISTWNRKN